MTTMLAADETETPRADATGAATRRYNFRRPDRVSKDHLRALRLLHERVAQQTSAALSTYLRGTIELTVASVDQSSYGEWQKSLGAPTVLYALALPPFDDLAALELDAAVAFAMIDRVMGGAGQGIAPDRALTDIELNVADSVVRLIAHQLTDVWKPVVDLTFGVRTRDTDPRMVSVAAPNDFVVVITFHATLGETTGSVALALPMGVIERAVAQLTQSRRKPQPATNHAERAWLQENLGRVPLEVTSLIETRLTAGEVLALRPGDVVSLGVALDDPLDLRVAGVRKLSVRLAARAGQALIQVVGGVAPRAGSGDLR